MFARLVLAAALFALLIHAWSYLPFLCDDALISLRYADRLLSGHGLTWTDGPRVEGYSNLLWILLCAGAGALGLDLIFAARLLGIIGMAIAIAVIWRTYLDADRERPELVAAGLAVLLTATAAPVAVWAVGGLEQPLIVALMATAIPATWRAMSQGRHVWAASWLWGLLCLARPDGPLLAGAAALAVLLAPDVRNRRRVVISLMVGTVVAVVAQQIFRLLYYDAWLPNPALVKIAPSGRVADGARYLRDGLVALAPFVILGTASLVAAWRRSPLRGRVLVLALPLVAWWGYLVFIGGDIFPAYRHHVVTVVILAHALGMGGGPLLHSVGSLWRSRPRTAGAIGLALVFVPYLGLQVADSANLRARSEGWEWDGKALALVLRDAFAEEQPLVAVTAAGCLPYWSELPSLDMYGLNDRWIARQKPADFGRGDLGHELGDGATVLHRRPDLVVFHTGQPADESPAGRELSVSEEFQTEYTPMRVRGTDPVRFTGVVFFRRESPRVGLVRDAGSITVPAHLLGAFGHTEAFLYGDRLAVTVTDGEPAGISLPGLSGEDWRVTVQGPDPKTVRAEWIRTDGEPSVVLRTDRSEPVVVTGLVLERH